MSKQEEILNAIKTKDAARLYTLLEGETDLRFFYSHRSAEGARDSGAASTPALEGQAKKS